MIMRSARAKVHSMDEQLRNAPQGYGHARLDTILPGMHRIDVTTWRPMPSLQQRVMQWYVGGGPELTAMSRSLAQQLCKGSDAAKRVPLNRMAMRSEAGGVVTLRLSCMLHGPPGCDARRA